ncbi:MAG: peptidylprolyl isomerase [Bacteroidetes bacterium]|nr:peptidylprolyl isomerase [Bacteroidota bacterium]MCL6103250.1 peptidylprolyl isomerase [Bacteroidota bacterium]
MVTVSKDSMVTLTYDLRLDGKEGEIFESATEANPLVFLHGAGLMIPAFEEQLIGKKTGEKFEIAIPAANGYGEINEEAVVELPLDIFKIDGKVDDTLLTPGNSVPMMSAHGQRMDGIVVSVQNETVTMDFNHPLAGEDLHFTGKVIEVREATADELNAAYSTGGCGCGSSCGSDGCGDSDCGSGESGSGCGGGCGCN